jgi:hypothetical protein
LAGGGQDRKGPAGVSQNGKITLCDGIHIVFTIFCRLSGVVEQQSRDSAFTFAMMHGVAQQSLNREAANEQNSLAFKHLTVFCGG